MPSYDWRIFQGRPLQQRFADSSTGYGQWVRLVEDLLLIPAPPADPAACYRVLDRFMAAVAPGAPVLPPQQECRLFVSHRSGLPDESWARQIAWHATQHGYEYWLDVDDPTLTYLNGSPIPSPAREVLIAAVIEMALLNCSHLAAVITRNSAGSKWIPYEYGRAKLRLLVSSHSSIWLDNGVRTADCGEYVRLSPVHDSGARLVQWLQQQRATSRCRSPGQVGWPEAPNPHPLPN